MKKTFIALIVLFPLLSFAQSSQKQIKSVIGTCYQNSDTATICTEEYYNKFGLLDSMRDNRYYIKIDKKYDQKGRIIQKEALFGESFGNGTTNYFYYLDSTLEKEAAGGFYRETLTIFSPTGDTSMVSEIFVSGGPYQSFKKTILYSFKNHQLIETGTTQMFYSLPDGYYEIELAEPDSIKSVLKTLEIYNTVQFTTKFEYNKVGKIISKTLNHALNLQKNYYSYDSQNRETKVVVLIGADTSSIAEYQYDKNGKRIKYTTTSFLKNGQNLENTVSKTQIIDIYDKKGNLLQENKSNNTIIYQIDYYKNGQLVKTEEFENDTKISSAIVFQYQYY